MNHQLAIEELGHLVWLKEKQFREHTDEGRHFDAKGVREQAVQIRETISFLQVEDQLMADLNATMKGKIPK